MTVISVVKDAAARTLTITARFDAPIGRVWKIWSDPRQLERWWGPPSYRATVTEHDLAPGGIVAYAMTGADGDRHRGWWRVRAVDPPHRLEFEDGFADADGNPSPDMPTTVIRVALSELAGGGTQMDITAAWTSDEAMQQVLATGTDGRRHDCRRRPDRRAARPPGASLTAGYAPASSLADRPREKEGPGMATYTVDLFTTLDGFGAGRVAPYWGKEGPELLEQRARTYAEEDQTLVYGANTYRLLERFLPPETDPSRAPLIAARKIVVSRTLEEPLTVANSTLIAEDALDAIPRLKAESPVALRCHGSIAMNRALLAAGLVDRLEVMVFPVITGASGEQPILAGLPDIDLEVVDSRLFDGRVQQLVYVPTAFARGTTREESRT